ncbi:hypothetical protein RhiirA1_405119, partial [Rhizophagus irregularis]
SFAADLGVNMHTVNKSYHELEKKGVIRIIPKSGAVIATHEKFDEAVFQRIMEDIKPQIAEALVFGIDEEKIQMMTLMPFLVKRTVVFGVSIPEQNIEEPKLAQFKKQYAIATFTVSVISLALFATWALINQLSDEQIVIVGTSIQFAIIIFSISLYFYFHGKTKKLKQVEKWTENLKQVTVTDLTIRNQDEMLPWYAYILPMIVTIGLIIYTLMNYDLLSNEIPTHWGPNGEPDAFTEKTPFTAIQTSLFLLIMQMMFTGIHIATKNSGLKLSATNALASKRRQLGMRKYSSWLLFIVLL